MHYCSCCQTDVEKSEDTHWHELRYATTDNVRYRPVIDFCTFLSPQLKGQTSSSSTASKKQQSKRRMNLSLRRVWHCDCVCRVAVLGKGEVQGGVVYELGRNGLRVTVRFP